MVVSASTRETVAMSDAQQVGRSTPRPADPGFLTGTARFVADVGRETWTPEHVGDLGPIADVVFVRSPYASAEIVGVDTAAAAAADGVLAVVHADEHGVVPTGSVIPGVLPPECAMPILAERVARHVGEPVVAVVAETLAQALDAAELVVIDWEPLDPVVELRSAIKAAPLPGVSTHRPRIDAPNEPAASNVVADHEVVVGPLDARPGEIVVSRRHTNPRQMPAPIETTGQICGWDAAGDLHVLCANQRPHGFRDQLASLYRVPADRIHVRTPHVGGAFGGKVGRTPEEHVVPELARRVGRPVRWIQSRGENFLGATQGRGEEIEIELRGDADGTIHSLNVHLLKDAGATPGVGAALPERYSAVDAMGCYDVASVTFRSQSVLTNLPQVSAFRGAGRAPMLAALERTIDEFAAVIGVAPEDVRRRNLVQPDQMPFASPLGPIWDEADYPGELDRALEVVDIGAVRAEQAARRGAGAEQVLGVGIACYHLQTVGSGGAEEASVTITPDGGAIVRTGTTTQGHGHDATWAQIAGDVLAMPIERIEVREGSTDETATGVGAVGSRSLQTAGVAVRNAAGEVVERARVWAASLLEADSADVVLADPAVGGGEGGFHVRGVPARVVSWSAVAEASHTDEGEGGELSCGDVHSVGDRCAFPSGCHIAVVEVDLATGATTLVRYVAVDDAGVRVNPMIVEGQLHGGIASGVSQVLGEAMVYDVDGNPLTTSFADYAIATIDQFPQFEMRPVVRPSSANVLGVKGVGESGVMGAVPAVHNAVVDAVAHLGVRHIDLPCTPRRVWDVIAEATRG